MLHPVSYIFSHYLKFKGFWKQNLQVCKPDKIKFGDSFVNTLQVLPTIKTEYAQIRVYF